jgi:hypothetical protein
MMQTQSQQHALADYVDQGGLQQRPGIRDTFPSNESLKWFVRRNRDELVARGAIIIITGRLRFHPDLFQEVAIDIGRRAARLGGQS